MPDFHSKKILSRRFRYLKYISKLKHLLPYRIFAVYCSFASFKKFIKIPNIFNKYVCLWLPLQKLCLVIECNSQN